MGIPHVVNKAWVSQPKITSTYEHARALQQTPQSSLQFP